MCFFFSFLNSNVISVLIYLILPSLCYLKERFHFLWGLNSCQSMDIFLTPVFVFFNKCFKASQNRDLNCPNHFGIKSKLIICSNVSTSCNLRATLGSSFNSFLSIRWKGFPGLLIRVSHWTYSRKLGLEHGNSEFLTVNGVEETTNQVCLN